MITRFTSNDGLLKLELSNYKFTFVEENNWLTDKTKSKYTYPLDFELTPVQVKALRGLTHQNSTNRNSVIEGKFMALGEVHEAVLEIETFIGNQVQAQIRYGFEEFPNYDKELSELPLEVSTVVGDFNSHAESIIPQTWPNVNYNFPQIHTDEIDNEIPQWNYFQGTINKFENSAFVLNEYDLQNDIAVNRNIMQPLPYVLHIFKKGFEDAGKTLTGDILEDVDFKKMCEYRLSDYYSHANTESEQLTLRTIEHLEETTGTSYALNNHHYEKEFFVNEPGRYKVAGNVIVRAHKKDSDSLTQIVGSRLRLSMDGVTIWYGQEQTSDYGYHEAFFSIDYNFNVADETVPLIITSDQLNYAIANDVIIEDAIICDFTITQLAKYDAQGNEFTSVVDPVDINLPKCVPDMSFGKYVNAYLKWKNYGIDIDGDNVIINKLKETVTSSSDKISLKEFEIEFPEVKTNQGKSFEIKFFDFETEEYTFKSVFANASGFEISPYTKNDDTSEIIIDAVPLPLKVNDGVFTAHCFLTNNSKSKSVIYDGLINGLNITKDTSHLLIPNVFENEHQDWIAFLLNSLSYKWVFETSFEKLSKLRVKSIIYAYKQYHIIRTLRRQIVTDESLEYEIETETLE